MFRSFTAVLLTAIAALVLLPVLFVIAVIVGANLGNNSAEFLVGSFYEYALHDYDHAANWFHSAALQGNPTAEYHLALIYDAGADHVENEQLRKKALYWYTQAAEQGTGNAQFLLSRMYLLAHGTPKDGAQASKWFILSTQHMTDFIKKHGLATAELLLAVPKSERDQGKVLADQWQAKSRTNPVNPPDL